VAEGKNQMPTVTYALAAGSTQITGNVANTRAQGQPHLASTTDGSTVLLTYTDILSATDRDIFARDFTTAGGSLTGGSTSNLASSLILDGDSDVSYAPGANNFSVSWNQTNATNADTSVQFTRAGLTGDEIGADTNVVAGNTTFTQASIASGANGTMMTFVNSAVAGGSILYKGFDNTGTLSVATFVLDIAASATQPVGAPAIAALSLTDTYVVAWEEDTDPGAGEDWAIKAQRVLQNGGAGAEVIIADEDSVANDVQRFPQVLGLTNGNYVVSYVDSNGGSTTDFLLEMDIRSGTTDGVVADEVLISNPAGDANFGGSYGLAQISANHFAVTYSYTTTGGSSGLETYVAVFQLDGTKLLETPISNSTNGSTAPDIAGVTGGGFVTAWNEADNSATDLGGGHIAMKLDQLVRTTTTNAGGETVVGDDIQDIFLSSGGADNMTGGDGDDSYVIDNAADVVVEGSGANSGNDKVFTSVDYTMAANVEVGFITVGANSNIRLTGNDGNNFLNGNAGNDIIQGGAGTDQMLGGAGNDTYAVDNSSDAVVEMAGGGFDNVYSSVNYEINEAQEVESALLSGGSAAAVILRGSSSDNRLTGNEFVNVIDGRGGTDYMLGLGGADIFQIGPEAGAVDVIGDFSKAEGDRIALAGFNAATTTVTQVSATSFQVVDTSPGGVTQQFILNDAIGNPNYTQGALVIGDDFYFA